MKWLIRARTSHDAHGVGAANWPSWTCANTARVLAKARSSCRVGVITCSLGIDCDPLGRLRPRRGLEQLRERRGCRSSLNDDTPAHHEDRRQQEKESQSGAAGPEGLGLHLHWRAGGTEDCLVRGLPADALTLHGWHSFTLNAPGTPDR